MVRSAVIEFSISARLSAVSLTKKNLRLREVVDSI